VGLDGVRWGVGLKDDAESYVAMYEEDKIVILLDMKYRSFVDDQSFGGTCSLYLQTKIKQL